MLLNSALCFLIIWITLASAVPAPANDAATSVFRKDYVFSASTNSFYKMHKISTTWMDANIHCRSEGATLAVPTTEEEALELVRQLDLKSNPIWIGMHDMYSEGDFVTINGIPISEIYSNWKKDEPNDVGGEDCVIMDKEGFYNDVPCNGKYRYICTKKNMDITVNRECKTYDLAYNLSSVTNRCYKLHTRPQTWNHAFRTCLAEMASLVELNSEDEAYILIDKLEKYPETELRGNFNKKLVHINFSDVSNHGEFETISGQTLKKAGYDEWAPGQPDNAEGDEYCGSMFRSGKLNDISCSVKAMFFCEKDA